MKEKMSKLFEIIKANKIKAVALSAATVVVVTGAVVGICAVVKNNSGPPVPPTGSEGSESQVTDVTSSGSSNIEATESGSQPDDVVSNASPGAPDNDGTVSNTSSPGSTSSEVTSSKPEKEDTVSKPDDVHKHSYVKKVVKPTCTKEGYTKYTCECGKSYKDKETKKLGHDYTEWTTTKRATSTSEGVKTCTCERCGKTKNKNIPKLEAPANVDSKIEVSTRFGVTTYKLDDAAVVDRRTWGETPTITVDKNDAMHVTYYNKEGKKVQFTAEQPPIDDYIYQVNILEDGTYNIQRIGAYS